MSERSFEANSLQKHLEDSLKKIRPTDFQTVTSEISDPKLLPICEAPLSIEWYTDWNEVAANTCTPNCSNPLHNHKQSLVNIRQLDFGFCWILSKLGQDLLKKISPFNWVLDNNPIEIINTQ